MAEPTVEQALQAMVNEYEGVTLEAGFRNKVRRVGRHLPASETLTTDELPAIYGVRPVGQTGNLEWQDRQLYKDVLDITVFGFIRHDGRNAEDAKLATLAERFLGDLKKVQMNDPSFGVPTIIKNSKLLTHGNDASWDDTMAVVTLGMQLTLYYDKTQV